MAFSGKNTQCSAKICSNNYSSNPSNSSLLDILLKEFCRLMLTNWRVTPEISNTEEVSLYDRTPHLIIISICQPGYYYAMYGADIVEKYRPKYQQKFPKNPLFMHKEPSFVEFVEYLVETPIDKYDEHWRPIFLLCPPCHFNFDVIVKMETFTR